MKWPAGAAALTLVALFAAITVSVVDARRPLDRDVTESFQSRVSTLAGRRATAECDKFRVDFYRCTATVAGRSQRTADALSYTVWLSDDGCWRAFRGLRASSSSTAAALASGSALIEGCVAGAKH